MSIRSLFAFTLTGTLVLVPLVPLGAHASALGASVSDSASIGTELQNALTTNANASVSAKTDVSAGESAAGTTTSDESATATPIVVTRADVGTEGVASSSADAALAAHARAVLSSDARISSISLSPARVMLAYRIPAKLFGVFSVSVPLTVSVAAGGATTVSYPWYGFLLAGDKAGLSIRAEAAAQSDLAATSTGSAKLSPEAQAALLNSLSAVLEAQGAAQASSS